jgi:hypothetical protein
MQEHAERFLIDGLLPSTKRMKENIQSKIKVSLKPEMREAVNSSH